MAEDTADLARTGGRTFMEEHRGPITDWTEFEAYPWPDPKDVDFRAQLALALQDMNLVDRARATWQAARTVDPVAMPSSSASPSPTPSARPQPAPR